MGAPDGSRAVDLSALNETPLIGKAADAARKNAEAAAGLRCGGCGERYRHGFEYRWVETFAKDGQNIANVGKAVACQGNLECHYQEQIEKGMVLTRRAVLQEWLTDGRLLTDEEVRSG